MEYRFHEHGVGYQKGKFLQSYRPQFSIIIDWIKKNSSVLDVGCGDGVLGDRLIRDKNCKVSGIDLDENGIKEALRHKIKAVVGNVDDGLPYPDQSFDVVVCNEVLQYVNNPDLVVSELLRVGKTVIISFPNFGFWLYRIQMLTGRFPNLSLFGHTWWNSHLTRMFSINDFLQLPAMKDIKISKQVTINWKNRKPSFFGRFFPNFFGRSCILKIKLK
jgi:methionine biosynthesis protein MetW